MTDCGAERQHSGLRYYRPPILCRHSTALLTAEVFCGKLRFACQAGVSEKVKLRQNHGVGELCRANCVLKGKCAFVQAFRIPPYFPEEPITALVSASIGAAVAGKCEIE